MRRLFNEHDQLTDEGQLIDQEFSVVCRALLGRHVIADVSLCDLELVLLHVVSDSLSELRFRRAKTESEKQPESAGG